MRPALRSTAAAAAVGAAAAVAALLVGVDRGDLVLDGYLVFLAGVVTLGAARIAAGAFPPPRGVVRRLAESRPALHQEPESLQRMEGLVALAAVDSLDFHVRLRPLLADVAAAGYAARTGYGQPGLPQDAERLFTPATWSIVRPDRPRPESGAPGIDPASLGSVLDELESILPR